MDAFVQDELIRGTSQAH